MPTQVRNTFTTGERVPSSGIYSVTHTRHHLFSEVAMFQGEVFPKCSQCSEAVDFRLLREFRGLDVVGVPKFRVPLRELPVEEREGDTLPQENSSSSGMVASGKGERV